MKLQQQVEVERLSGERFFAVEERPAVVDDLHDVLASRFSFGFFARFEFQDFGESRLRALYARREHRFPGREWRQQDFGVGHAMQNPVIKGERTVGSSYQRDERFPVPDRELLQLERFHLCLACLTQNGLCNVYLGVALHKCICVNRERRIARAGRTARRDIRIAISG